MGIQENKGISGSLGSFLTRRCFGCLMRGYLEGEFWCVLPPLEEEDVPQLYPKGSNLGE
uniref:Uncharacterized protein n=1 Tax=Helianthus annuus TaxID=4232 RepID=A0A251UHU4_HELAN